MPVDRCIETHLLIALVPSLSFSSSSSSMQLVQQTAFLQVPSIKTMITLHANKQRVKLDNGSSIALNLLTIVAIQILGAISLAEAAEASTGEFNIDQQYQQTGGSGAAAATNRHAHPALLVDTKYWAKNMEFGEKDNWRWARKPCTLIERIAIEQQEAIVSLGDSMDALGGPLETNIRELIMAQDGILLLEEDTLASDPMDPMFVQFLNQTGDCYDSSSSAAAAEDGKHTELFEFEPNPNDISWFNPSNWLSAINQADGIDHLVPDSHRIPCSEDVVVFGDRHAAFWSLVEGNERAKIISFKVNFRPAEDEQNQLKLVNANSVLRVSKLKIGDKSYSQAEFDKLISLYGDNLFELTNNHSVFSIGQVFDNSFIDNKKILTIDESSIQANAENDLEVCLDEAGCLCGNEQFDVMQIICSFNEPIDESGLPCRDPIKVSGYCNKICATNMIIMIDPNRFSEPYLINELNKLNEAFGEHIFVGSRRVDYNRYEITLRSITTDENDYELNLGLELEFAKLIKGSLEKAATKSFYGIKSIGIKSSSDWRRNNRGAIFMITFGFMSSLLIIISINGPRQLRPLQWLTDATSLTEAKSVGDYSSDNFRSGDCPSLIEARTIQPTSYDSSDQVNFKSGETYSSRYFRDSDVAMVDIDTQSVTDSTINLIDSNS